MASFTDKPYTHASLETEKKKLVSTFNRYLTYPPNWDAEGLEPGEKGAEAFTSSTISNIIACLEAAVKHLHTHKRLPYFEPFPGNCNDVELDIHLNANFVSITANHREVFMLMHTANSGRAIETTDIEKAMQFLCA